MFAPLKNKLDLIFSKGWSFLRPKNKLGLVSFVILSSLFVTAWFVFTTGVNAGGVGDWVIGVFSDIFFAIAGFFIKLTFWVLKFVIEIAGYNGYIDSPAVTVGWVMIRDMTNMVFIVVLLIISFGTILGLEHYEWKKMLVKVIAAAVVVNFSRIICGVIIDIAQIVMLTFVNGIAATASGNLVNMFNVQDIFKLNGGSSAGGGTAPSIFLAAVAALVFSTMMLVTMGTFLLLLMARMAMLWVLIVMSPFAFVLNVLPQTEKYASQWWGQFGGHVIGGPVIVFFLWLSFVTVGSGGIHDDIKKFNGLPSGSLMGDGSSAPEGEQLGITDIMSWEKMANFVIAIAMLLAGAKMATELGMAGGEMMGKAKDIGKKVAMYASGYQAARWGAGKAWDAGKSGVVKGGKWAGMNLLGGNYVKRKGEEIKARASIFKSKLDEKRNTTAADVEKKAQELSDLKNKLKTGKISKAEYAAELKNKGLNRFTAGALRIGGGFAAGVVESQGRKEKRVEDWEKAAENRKKIVEETYSTSSSPGGLAKKESDIKLKKVMDQAEGKKAEKYIKEEDRMRRRAGVVKLEDKLAKETDPAKKIDLKHKIHHEKEEYEGKYGDFGGIDADDRFYAQRMATATKSKASAENIQKVMNHEKELGLAEARAEQLRGQGKNAEAAVIVASVHAHHFEEEQKAFSNMDYAQKVNESEEIAQQLKKLDVKLVAGTISSEESAKLANLRKSAMQMLSAAGKDGQETFQEVLKTMIKVAKGTIMPGGSIVHGSPAMKANEVGVEILRAITGRGGISDAASFNEAHELIDNETFHGRDESQAVLSLLANVTESVAGKGENRAAGSVETIQARLAGGSHTEAAKGSATAYRLHNSYDGGRVINGTQTATEFKQGKQQYRAPRTDMKQMEYIEGFADTEMVVTTPATPTTPAVEELKISRVDKDLLLKRLNKFKDERDVATNISSAFVESTDPDKFTTSAENNVIDMLNELHTSYASDPDVYNKIRDTVFKGWKAKFPARIP